MEFSVLHWLFLPLRRLLYVVWEYRIPHGRVRYRQWTQFVILIHFITSSSSTGDFTSAVFHTRAHTESEEIKHKFQYFATIFFHPLESAQSHSWFSAESCSVFERLDYKATAAHPFIADTERVIKHDASTRYVQKRVSRKNSEQTHTQRRPDRVFITVGDAEVAYASQPHTVGPSWRCSDGIRQAKATFM